MTADAVGGGGGPRVSSADAAAQSYTLGVFAAGPCLE